MGAALLVVPAHRRRLAVGRAARARRRAAPAARRRRRDGRRRRRVAAAVCADARRRTARGSRARATTAIWSLIFGYNGLGRARRPGRRPGGGGGGAGGGGGGGPFGGVDRRRCGCSTTALGGQAGWLLGFALVGGIAHRSSRRRLRRGDARTGWLIAVGGAFVPTAVAFSFAKGIFHPYYVSLLAPFTRRAGRRRRRRCCAARRRSARVARARWRSPAASSTELVVLATHRGRARLGRCRSLLVGRRRAAAIAARLAARAAARARSRSPRAGALLLAPATWAVQTLGHATSGTFPAGGPARPPARRLRRRRPAAPAASRGAACRGGRPRRRPAARAAAAGRSAATAPALERRSPTRRPTAAARSPSPASRARPPRSSPRAPTSPALGGFSGRESEVTSRGCADAVRGRAGSAGCSDGGGGFGAGGVGRPPAGFGGALPGGPPAGGGLPGRGFGGARGGPGNDGRVGSRKALAAVAKACRKVPASSLSSTSTGTLYDCAGRASALKG